MTEGFTETKEITTRLKEPYKIKLVPFAKGYAIEVTANLSSELVDHMLDPDGEIVQMIENSKKLITENLNSKILIIEKVVNLDNVKLQPDQKVKKK